jgi:hypothetical protein
VDFNLQIPANAAFFYVLCGLAASKPLETITKPWRLRLPDERTTKRRPSSANGDSLDWSP